MTTTKTKTTTAEAEKVGCDPVALAASYASAADKSAKLLGEFVSRQAGTGASLASDELGLSKAFFELAAKMLSNPYRMAETQLNLMWDYSSLWQARC
jgi:polyhydroxyalkanoate synthase